MPWRHQVQWCLWVLCEFGRSEHLLKQLERVTKCYIWQYWKTILKKIWKSVNIIHLVGSSLSVTGMVDCNSHCKNTEFMLFCIYRNNIQFSNTSFCIDNPLWLLSPIPLSYFVPWSLSFWNYLKQSLPLPVHISKYPAQTTFEIQRIFLSAYWVFLASFTQSYASLPSLQPLLPQPLLLFLYLFPSQCICYQDSTVFLPLHFPRFLPRFPVSHMV